MTKLLSKHEHRTLNLVSVFYIFTMSREEQLQMSETIKVSDYIEQKYKQLESRFSDFEWLKLYLETVIAQREFHLVDRVFLTFSEYNTESSKWRCVNIINGIVCTLVDHVDSKLLSETFIASKNSDEKFLIVSTLAGFLIQDLLNVVIAYSLSTRIEVGMYIDALDADSSWDIGEIKQIFQYKNNLYISIHFLECSDWYDECIIASNERIRLLYDDSGQIVYKWKISSEVVEVDYRRRGQSNWKRGTRSEVVRYSSRTNVAPAGTFL